MDGVTVDFNSGDVSINGKATAVKWPCVAVRYMTNDSRGYDITVVPASSFNDDISLSDLEEKPSQLVEILLPFLHKQDEMFVKITRIETMFFRKTFLLRTRFPNPEDARKVFGFHKNTAIETNGINPCIWEIWDNNLSLYVLENNATHVQITIVVDRNDVSSFGIKGFFPTITILLESLILIGLMLAILMEFLFV